MAITVSKKPKAKKPKAPAAAPGDGAFSVQWMPVNSIKRYNNNPRINAHAVQAVRNSLNEFGWRQPIVVDKDHIIVVGDTRYLAAKELGYATVPVHVATDLNDAQIRAYRIADNKVGEISNWDDTKLLLEIAELSKSGIDLHMVGFSQEEIDAFTKPAEDTRHLEAFDISPSPKPVWILIASDTLEHSRIMHALNKLNLKGARIETSADKAP